MPVHKVGYRPWDGKKTPQWNRWWIITETGFRIAFKSAWVRRILLLCWLPVLYWGVAVFMIEQTLELRSYDETTITSSGNVELAEAAMRKEMAKGFVEWLEDDVGLPETEALIESLERGEKQEIRHVIWSWLIMTFFRYPQGTAVLFLLGFIVPGLISRDVRSRAFLLYFSRPIGRIEYILGKFLVPAVFLLLITMLPALCLFFFGVTLSPDLSVLWATWDIPLRILAASACVVIPTCSIALMLSSVTQESRFATFAWFAIWALGHAAWFAILITQAIRLDEAPFESEVLNDPVVQSWSVVSLYNNLSLVQSWIFGFAPLSDAWPSILALAIITIVSLVLLYRGVSAPMNV